MRMVEYFCFIDQRILINAKHWLHFEFFFVRDESDWLGDNIVIISTHYFILFYLIVVGLINFLMIVCYFLVI